MARLPDYVEFDPDGDILLILPHTDEGSIDDEVQGRIGGGMKNDDGDGYDDGQDDGQGDQAGGGDRSGQHRHEDTWETYWESPGHPDDSATAADSGTLPGGIQMRVSSKHLSLVSPVFARLMKGQFAESLSLRSAGTIEVPLPGDDPLALQIICNIIHGHFRKVPRKVDIGLLTQIAILIDKYALHEIAEMCTDMWFQKLEEEIPQTWNEELMPWLCVSWVLRKPKAYRQITRTAMQESQDKLENTVEFDLPIPRRVLEAINESRETALSRSLSTINHIQRAYEEPGKRCDAGPDCDAMVLGGLLKALRAQDLLPPPAPPFKGLSFKDLDSKISQMHLPTLCERLGLYRGQGLRHFSVGRSSGGECGIRKSINNALYSEKGQLKGLELE